MNTIFVGCSRHVSRLPALARVRIENVLDNGDMVIVGDAAGANRAAQKLLRDAGYQKVTVFCSGDAPRNNLGRWPVERISVPRAVKGFHFHAAKDREMARRADFGLMVWDGQSVGTLLDLLRLIRAGRKAVLANKPAGQAITMKLATDWIDLVRGLDSAVFAETRAKATSDEWIDPALQAGVAPALVEATPPTPSATTTGFSASQPRLADLDEALAADDTAAVLLALRNLANARGVTTVATRAGSHTRALVGAGCGRRSQFRNDYASHEGA